jgi:hypothetical protein
MRTRTKKWLARLALPLALSLAGCPPPDHGDGDDDSMPGDDDSAAGDDDTAVEDDDTGDDDVMEDYGPRSDNGAGAYHPDLLRELEE